MQQIDHHYIDGQFVASHGRRSADLHNPATEAVIGQVRLGDASDAARAIAAAKAALPKPTATVSPARGVSATATCPRVAPS